MRIITWNVNGLRAVEKKSEIHNLISTYDPDIILMQEIKGTSDKFSAYLNSPESYQVYYNPAEKAGYAGTGAWVHARVLETHEVSFFSSFPGDPTANEGRVAHVVLKRKPISSSHHDEGSDLVSENKIAMSSTTETGGLLAMTETTDIFGIYFPNGGKSEEAWQGKLVFYREFSAYMDSLRILGHSVLWGGDINCAHEAIDLARPQANDGKIGFHPLERAWLDTCAQDGWHDIWREANPDLAEVYSWWDPVTRSRDRNVGWRIDAFWGDDSIIAKTRNIEYIQNQMGSDHCPMIIELEI